MNLSRMWTVARLELLQRVRSVSWYVLLGVFALLLAGVTGLAFLSYGGWGDSGPGVFSVVVYVTLLLVLLVSPTLSGNSINGDRDAATLAPVQVTLASTGDILWGKFVAAWLTGLAFAAVGAPFLVIATFAGGVDPWAVVTSLVILVVEIGVVAAIGVALSGIVARPLFSVAVTYLVVAALAAGTVIGFGLVGTAVTSEATQKSRSVQFDDQTGQMVCRDGSADCWGDLENMVCGDWETTTYQVPRFDRVWWMLAANPFVILADATPTGYDAHGNPDDLFGWIKTGVRAAQLPQPLETTWDDCSEQSLYGSGGPNPHQIIDQTVPSWFVGLGGQVVLAGGLLWWAWARTRTPSRSLPPGTRIA